ncbi:hypothetical protein Tco_0346336 [Tanacetum coccineum]
MAAYQQMIAETDPTRREEALTAYGTETGQSSVPVPKSLFGGVRSLPDTVGCEAPRGSMTEEEGGTRGSGPANLP